jgi:hypothetical protein
VHVTRLAVTLAVLAALATSCAAGGADPSAPYFPRTRPAASTPAPLDPALTVPEAPLITAVGEVSRPNLRVTPGIVDVRDVAAICQQGKHPVHPPIPASWDQAVYSGYGIAPKDQGKYRLDFLVPLDLGGAQALPNLWPMSLRGIGFHEKQRLNARLRNAVCQGQLSLDQAQRDVVADWYALWVKYAAF